MSATAMHFGPEWMRPKPALPSRSQANPPSPPMTGASSYSALVSSVPPSASEQRDESHPFRYSKENLLRIYKEGGGKGGLGLEVERWEGVVRELGSDPIGLREMSEAERKLFAGPLNSELRRRQSTDILSPLATQNLDRPRMNHPNSASGQGSPMRDRFGGLMVRRRESTDQAPSALPRKLSFTGTQPGPLSPRDGASPRTRFTPGFDGVLNSGGESWIAARRRASEGPKAGTLRDEGKSGTGIKEEEEKPDVNHEPVPDAGAATDTTQNSSLGQSALQSSGGLGTSMAHLSLEQGQGNPSLPRPQQSHPVSQPLDLAAVEWSYLDPQEQIQGPFRADVMQKWYDEGYFTPELRMKRTRLDSEWQTVASLSQQTIGDRIFLSPPVPAVPPGLSSILQHNLPAAQDPNVFSSPFQPAPLRNIRSSTLDSFGTGSNPSDSPSSSLGASRFVDSPDPNAFGGRATASYDPLSMGRNGFSGNDSPSSNFSRRNTFADVGTGSPSLANMPTRGSSTDSFGFTQVFPSNTSPWQSNNSLASGAFENHHSRLPPSDPFNYNSSISQNRGLGSVTTPSDPFLSGPVQRNGFADDFVDASPIRTGASLHQGWGASEIGSPAHRFHGPSAAFASTEFDSISSQSPLVSTPGAMWGSRIDSPGLQTSSPFEVQHHPPANSTLNSQVPALDPSPWDPSGASQVQQPPSSWLESAPSVSNTLRRQRPREEAPAVPQMAPPVAPEPQPSPSQMPEAASAAVATTKARTKSITQNIAPPADPKTEAPITPAPTTAAPPPLPSPPTSAAARAAPWSKEDDSKKTKPIPPTMSLREIQEAEKKKEEARKAAEREREKATRAAAAAASPSANGNEEPQSFSWGLVSSHTNQRNGSSAAKDFIGGSPTAAAPAQPAPVWTNAAKPAASKKTMKEIQEEEERRRKAAATAKETTGTQVQRRAYAESMSKASQSSQGQSAWSTVGSNGKANATAPPARPSISAAVSAPAISTTARSNGTIARPPAPPASVKAAATHSKSEDFPVGPSTEFLKWLADALKGLNSSVNTEEIVSMLLSFPLDPDSSTVGIIAETIYSSSTTMDGRRFAAEFVKRRKQDAASRKGTAASAGASNKPVSIADIVKAQPKQQSSPEWGGFKVVNKKKKSGRA